MTNALRHFTSSWFYPIWGAATTISTVLFVLHIGGALNYTIFRSLGFIGFFRIVYDDRQRRRDRSAKRRGGAAQFDRFNWPLIIIFVAVLTIWLVLAYTA